MNKFIKMIRSRYFLSVVVILLEFILLMTVFILLYKYFPPMAIMAYIFYVGVFLYIINKYKTPEFKLTWVIILLLLSVIGAYIFILLVSSGYIKDKIKKYVKVKKDLRNGIDNTEILKELKEKNLDVYSQVNYICNAIQLPCYKNTKTTYYYIGEKFFEDLLIELEKAEKYIFMEYFIIEEGFMWNSIYDILKNKAKQGIKVYVMYDDFGCLSTLNENYYKKMQKDGINAIPSNKLKPELSVFYNNRDHRKITVIDGNVGFSGGINLADEYINKKVKHGHWKDTAVKIEGPAVQNLVILFLEMWNIQNKNDLLIEDFNIGEILKFNSESIVIPFGDGPEEFYEDNIGKNVYLNMINSSKKTLYITTPYLICDYELLNSLCLASKRGIDVNIIVPHIPDKKLVFWMTQSNYELLIKNGVKIFEYTKGFIHAKNFISDDKYAICGTINLDYRSLVHHFECGIWMYNSDCIRDMKKDFINTMEISEEVPLGKSKLKGWKKLVAEILKVFSPLL